MSNEFLFIAGFIVFIGFMMAVDLGLFGKANKPVSLKQAAIMSGVWVALAMVFYVLILNFGHLLHDVHTMRRLQEINQKHLNIFLFNTLSVGIDQTWKIKTTTWKIFWHVHPFGTFYTASKILSKLKY